MDKLYIRKRILESFFNRYSVDELWAQCPCQMLWEAVKAERSSIITKCETMHILATCTSVFIIPEPLPAIYLNVEPAFLQIPQEKILNICQSWINNSCERSFFKIEPLYIVNSDFSWMIILTSENTSLGDQLCVFVSRE